MSGYQKRAESAVESPTTIPVLNVLLKAVTFSRTRDTDIIICESATASRRAAHWSGVRLCDAGGTVCDCVYVGGARVTCDVIVETCSSTSVLLCGPMCPTVYAM